MMIATTGCTSLILLLLLSCWGGCYGYPQYRTVMALSQPSTASSLSQHFLRKQGRTDTGSTTTPVVLVQAATTVSCRRNQSCRRHLRDDLSDDNNKDVHHHQNDAVVTPSSSATTPTTATSSNNNSGTAPSSENSPSSVILSNNNSAAAKTDRSNRVLLLVGIGVAAVVVLIALLLLVLLRSDNVRTRCRCRHTTKQYHNNRLAHHHPKHTSSSLKDGPPSSNNNHESTTSREEEDMNCNSSFSSHDDSPPPSGRSVVQPVLLDDPSTWYDQSLITMEGFTISGESYAGKTTAPVEGFSIRSGFTIPSETGGGGGGGIIISTTARPAQRNTGSMDDNISLSDDIVSCLDSSLAMTDPDPSFVVVTRTVSLPPSRRLGIQIGDTANGPTIMSVRHDSPCADYLFEGDVIIQLGDVIMTRRPNDDCTNRNGSHNENVMRLLSATEIAHWLDERCHEPRRTIMVQSRLEQ